MKYAIQINGGPGPVSPAEIGYQFIRAALAGGHGIVRVFFYHEGVREAFPAVAGGRDWSGLARDHGIDLVLCVAALERRGLGQATPAGGFRSGGLGQWMEACLAADRTLSLGS
jgi:tRNA 2-thiouridine synthesizing protein D